MNNYLTVKRTYFWFVLMFSVFLNGCKEDIGTTVNKIGAVAPNVSNIEVTSVSGGAIIKYNLPKSEDLRYIKATYTLDNGITRESKSSIYQNEIFVDGFGLEGEYEVKLQSVSVGEVMSEPLVVKVNVLRPPYLLTLDQIISDSAIDIAFGGFNIDYENAAKANLIIRVVKKDSVGEWEIINSTYTKLENGIIRIREQKEEPTDFGVYIQDRWEHKSDIYSFNLTPIEEVEIPTDDWQRYFLPSDAGVRATGFAFNGIWDGNINYGYLSTNNPNNPDESIELPNSVTIDLGTPVLLSRMQIWATRSANVPDIYGSSHLYDFEIFGSNDPNPTGEWDDSWTSLGRFVSVRPSGYGIGVPATAEEIESIRQNGEEYDFPDPTDHDDYRYIRFKNYATWNGFYEGPANFFIYELRLFGQY